MRVYFYVLSQGKCFQGAFLFASLLSLKHIFLYIAPAIGIYLLRTCCITTDRRGVPRAINFGPLFAFGGIVGSVAAVAFGPFYKHIPQVWHIGFERIILYYKTIVQSLFEYIEQIVFSDE